MLLATAPKFVSGLLRFREKSGKKKKRDETQKESSFRAALFFLANKNRSKVIDRQNVTAIELNS